MYRRQSSTATYLSVQMVDCRACFYGETFHFEILELEINFRIEIVISNGHAEETVRSPDKIWFGSVTRVLLCCKKLGLHSYCVCSSRQEYIEMRSHLHVTLSAWQNRSFLVKKAICFSNKGIPTQCFWHFVSLTCIEGNHNGFIQFSWTSLILGSFL